MALDKPRLAFVYLTDLRKRSADVVQSAEMCDALQAFFHVRLYHPAISKNRFQREVSYWDIDAQWELQRLATLGPNRLDWFDYPSRVAYLSQALLDLHFRPVDIIFTRDPSLLYLLRALPSLMRPKAPIIYEAHKLYHRVSDRVDSRQGEARAISSARHIVAISPGVRDDMLALGIDRRRIDVLPLGVRLKRFQTGNTKAELKVRVGLDPDRPVIAYAGSWHEQKGVETLITAFSQIAESDDRSILVLIGVPDEHSSALRAGLSAMGLGQDRVILLNHMSRRNLTLWLSAADIGVAPNTDSLLSGNYTSPLKVFEYLAAGLALVASDVPALRALLSDEETLFAKVGDADDMAIKLSRLLLSESERKNRQAAARIRAKLFNYEVRAERLREISTDLLAKPN